jgi:hypothetical protein
LKLYASDLQTFLGGRTILREVEEEEMYVTALLEEKCLQQVNALFLYLVMDFSSLIRDICKILFPVPYHSLNVTGNVFQSILNTVNHS